MRLVNNKEARQLGGPLAEVRSVNRMMEDNRQRLWLVSENQGLLCFDGKTMKRYFQDEQDRSMVRDICQDREGRIFIGTAHRGVFLLEGGVPCLNSLS